MSPNLIQRNRGGLIFACCFAAVLAVVMVARRATAGEAAVVEFAAGLFVALWGYFQGASERRWRRRQQSWRRTDGEIISSEVVKMYRWGAGSTSYYEPRVSYRFAVDGAEVQGDKLQMTSPATIDASEARATVARYPAGAAAPVFYDPRNPKLSVLEFDDDGDALFRYSLLVLIVCTLAACVFAVVSLTH